MGNEATKLKLSVLEFMQDCYTFKFFDNGHIDVIGHTVPLQISHISECGDAMII